MYQLYYTALEAGLASIVLIPILLVLNRLRIQSFKTTIFYILFAVYLAGIYAVVGLPNITYIRFDPNINIIPFTTMLSDLSGTLLNVLLFVPLGIFLPLLWTRFQNLRWVLLYGFGLSLIIELLQMFTLRATDVNDLITNTAGALLGYGIACLAGRIFPGLQCKTRNSDLFFLVACSAGVMFFLQPVIWDLIY